MVCPECNYVTVSLGHLFCPIDGARLRMSQVHRVGDVGVRDTEFPCEMFDSGKTELSNMCESDEHYVVQHSPTNEKRED